MHKDSTARLAWVSSQLRSDPRIGGSQLSNTAAAKPTTHPLPDSLLFWAGVLASCVWILLLPVFPSEDGPVHLYYATVLAKLLHGAHGPLTAAFVIRHVLPPYSLYYYLLIVLLAVFPAVLVEKLVAAIIVVTLAAGFRALCTAAGKNGAITSFLILPVLLNWPLFMGFQNYVLSVGITMVALAVWFAHSRYRRPVFLLLVAAVVLAHPVPLVALLAVCAIDLSGRRFGPADAAAAERRRGWRLDLLTLAGACVLMSYVALFTQGDKVRSNLLHHIHVTLALRQFATLYGLGLFARISGPTLVYTGLLYGCMAIGVFLTLRSWRVRAGGWRPVDALAMATLLFLLVLPALPDTMNGGYYFNTRMLILAWCGVAASASGGPPLSRRWRSLVMATSALALVVTLVLAQQRVVPTARRAAIAERIPVQATDVNALLLPATPYQADPVLRFRPLEWSGVRLIRRAGDVMLDAPFLDMATMPVNTRQPELDGTVVPGATNALPDLVVRAHRDPAWAHTLLRHADLVVFQDEFHRSSAAQVERELHSDGRPEMRCFADDWLYICRGQ